MEKFSNMVELLQTRAADKDRINYIFLGDNLSPVAKMTYAQLWEKAKIIAGKVQTVTKRYDRVLLIYSPGLELISAFFGCMAAGVIPIFTYPPANKKMAEKITSIIHDATPKLILSSTEIIKQLQKLRFIKIMTKIPFINSLIRALSKETHSLAQWKFETSTWIITTHLSKEFAKKYNPVEIKNNDIAFLQYTSGSIGDPKGVMATHGNVLDNLEKIAQIIESKESDIAIIWIPPYHDFGLIGGLLSPLYRNFRVYLMSPFSFLRNPISWLTAITKYRATISCAPDFAFAICSKKIPESAKAKLDLNNWRICVNGSEPIHIKTVDRFVKDFESCGFNKDSFLFSYGLAEATLFVSSRLGVDVAYYSKKAFLKHELKPVKADDEDAIGFINHGHPPNRVIIVNPSTKKICPSETIGEIWVNSPSVGLGYWNQPELSKEIFQAHLADNDPTPFLRTGDLGFLKEGNLFITGRIKDLILISGENHYPQDIEQTVWESHRAIRVGCCAAFSIDVDDREQLAIATEIYSSTKKNEMDKVIAAIKHDILKDHQLPVYYIALLPPRAIPKTTSGKIQRNATKNLVLENKKLLLKEWVHHE